MIRKIILNDKKKYVEMSKDFYNTDAVLHSIPEKNILKTFDFIISDNPYTVGYFYEYKSEIAGYLLLSFTYSNEFGGMVMWIEEIYIIPKFQGRGFGKDLIKFAENKYKDKIIKTRLEVEESNNRAISLYRKLGFLDLNYNQMYK